MLGRPEHVCMHYMDTHVGRFRGGQTAGGCAPSLACHDMSPCASTRPAEHPLPDWQRAMQQTHPARRGAPHRRTTLQHVWWETHPQCKVVNNSPISRGAAEQAASTCKQTSASTAVGPIQAPPNECLPGRAGRAVSYGTASEKPKKATRPLPRGALP